MCNDFQTCFGTDNMCQTETHCVKDHVLSFLTFWRSAEGKGIAKRERKDFDKSQEYDTDGENAYP
jgi:hypothetical protein